MVEHARDPGQRRIWRIHDPFGKANKYALDSGWRSWAEKIDGNSAEDPGPGEALPAQGSSPSAPQPARPPRQPAAVQQEIPARLPNGKPTGRFRELRPGWKMESHGQPCVIISTRVNHQNMLVVIKKDGREMIVVWRGDGDMRFITK